jgi:hypothetical protein
MHTVTIQVHADQQVRILGNNTNIYDITGLVLDAEGKIVDVTLKEDPSVAHHREQHAQLHKELDELVADFIQHNKDKLPSRTPILDLIMWSHEQTLHPTPGN